MDAFRVSRIDELASIHHGAVKLTAQPGTMLWVAADSRRRLVAGTHGVRVLAIGCAPGSYERPETFRLAASA